MKKVKERIEDLIKELWLTTQGEQITVEEYDHLIKLLDAYKDDLRVASFVDRYKEL